MGKDSYYFSHDSNARNDPKILAMRSVYGIQGYGMYWVIVEMLREQEDYKLKKGKYIFNSIAMQMQGNAYAPSDAKIFVDDCINEFELFKEDETHIWAESLLKRMEIKDDVSEKRRNAANKRWRKANDSNDTKQEESKEDANAMQLHSKSNAIKRKESKEKESKLNKQQQEKDNVVVVVENPHKFYQENFGVLSPFMSEEIGHWSDDLNEDLVIAAMKIALQNNKPWKYATGVLKDWEKHNLKTLDDVEAYNKQRNGSKGNEGSFDLND